MSILPRENLQATSPAGRISAFLTGFGLAVILLWAVSHATSGRVASWWRNTFGELRISMDQPTVVQRVQNLQRLESIKYTLERIVTGERQGRFLPQALTGEKLLLIVHGEVYAGVDMSKLKPDQVQVKGKQVQIALPGAEIFSTRLDNNQTRVFSRETGLLVQADPNLESEVRAEAERQIQQAALDDGILANASTNARNTITTFLQALGFVDVQVH